MVGKTGRDLKLDGWTPIRVYWREGEREPQLDWCLIGKTRFTDPFFKNTVQRHLYHPFHQAFRRQTPIRVLQEWSAERPGIAPTGFIFHMSRCGSTLITQMLSALDQNVVLSEAAPLDIVLRSHLLDTSLGDTSLRDASITDEERIEWFRGMVSALGQRRSEGEKHLFIKFDCWNIAELPLIQRAFPDVPWIFVFRDPVEVLASHLQTPGGWTLPSILPPATLHFEAAAVSDMPHHEYRVRALARICELALFHHQRAGGLLVNYTQLPDAVCSLLPRGFLLQYFDVGYEDQDLNRMREAAQYNAKMPGFKFEGDTDKRNLVTEEMRGLVARWIDPLYRQLESSRKLAEDRYAIR